MLIPEEQQFRLVRNEQIEVYDPNPAAAHAVVAEHRVQAAV
jgi:hypothetical protein